MWAGGCRGRAAVSHGLEEYRVARRFSVLHTVHRLVQAVVPGGSEFLDEGLQQIQRSEPAVTLLWITYSLELKVQTLRSTKEWRLSRAVEHSKSSS